MKIKGSRKREKNSIILFFIVILSFSVYFFLVNNKKINYPNIFVDTTELITSEEFGNDIDTTDIYIDLEAEYTIQLTVSDNYIDLESDYFKNLLVDSKKSKSDNKYRYFFGIFSKEDAEMLMDTISSLGFKDAFIRDVDWYKMN